MGTAYTGASGLSNLAGGNFGRNQRARISSAKNTQNNAAGNRASQLLDDTLIPEDATDTNNVNFRIEVNEQDTSFPLPGALTQA